MGTHQTLNMPSLQGVRIDYVLLSAGLVPHVVSCEVISKLPPKWSDHAALLLELRDIPPVQPHPPCALSSARMKRFAKPKASIASMFAKRRSDDGAGMAVPAAKRARSDSAAAEVEPAVLSAAGVQGTSQEPDGSMALAGEDQPPVGLEGSEDPAPANIQCRCEDQAGRSEADKVLLEAGHEQAGVELRSRTGITQSSARLPHASKSQGMPEHGGSRALPAAAIGSAGQLQAGTPSKSKGRRTRSKAKAGDVLSSPKQKSIRGFFTAQQ